MKTYKRSEVEKLTVPDIKVLVRKHNLHTNFIKNYSRLRKADLVSKFMEHYKKSPIPAGSEQLPKRASKVPAAAAAGPAKKPKKVRGSSKPKVTAFDRAMGVDKPLYKEGVEKGATKQFEKRYGKVSDDARFLKNLQKEMEQERLKNTGRGKRKKKKVQNPDFEYSKATRPRKRK